MQQKNSYSDDFVIRIATVNGSGSASSNGIISKALFRSGIKVVTKNRFPSNIQGMPTYYDIRINKDGWQGACEEISILIALNKNSLDKDQKSVKSEGLIIYDSTAYLKEDTRKNDVKYIGVPITSLATEIIDATSKRINIQNLIYVGIVSAVLKIERRIVSELISERYKEKSLLTLNQKAFSLGYQEGLKYDTTFEVNDSHKTIDPNSHIFTDGNFAIALGCLYAGATVVGWYPITPSTSVIEYFEALCKKYRVNEKKEKSYAIIQCEDEISAIGTVIGAQWNGARAFTATSGPGLSLMNEFLGYAYYSETPAVLFDIQRSGPSTGLPTNTQQSDITMAAYASHGDTKQILLFPGNVEECFEFAAEAFNIADCFQTPVIVMSDLNLGMNNYVSKSFEWKNNFNRGKILDSSPSEGAPPYFRYKDIDNDGVTYRSLPGVDKRLAFFTRGSGHDELGKYTEDPKEYSKVMMRLNKKYRNLTKALPDIVHVKHSAKQCLVYFGSSEEIISELVNISEESFDLLRIRSFPFSEKIDNILNSYEKIIVLEQNRDEQMARLLKAEIKTLPQIASIALFDGQPLTAKLVAKKLAGETKTREF